jgi:hypothetical protein
MALSSDIACPAATPGTCRTACPQHPRMGQQRPSFVAEKLRPQRAIVTRWAGPATPGQTSCAGPSRGPSRWWAPPDPEFVLLSAFDALQYGVRSLFATCRVAAHVDLPLHIGQAFRSTRSNRSGAATGRALKFSAAGQLLVLTPGIPAMVSRQESLDTGAPVVADRAAYRCKEEENKQLRAFHPVLLISNLRCR